MTEIELILDLHRNTNRQGPGSEEDTLSALNFIDLPGDQDLQIADIGCSSGGPTLTLAKALKGQMIAVDLFPIFLTELENKAKTLGLTNKIQTLQCSMDELPFGKNTFDLIWSEGAIYNIGFKNGTQQWREYLKPGGYLAISEITWISQTRPQELEDFWAQAYPEINTAAHKIKQLEDNGYSLAGYFYLSSESWINNYYQPLIDRFEAYLKRHQNTPLAKKVVREVKAEFKRYQEFKDYYSYGFYIARKTQ